MENRNQLNNGVSQIFDQIYLKKIWGEGSGPGSREKNSREYLAFLNSFMSKNKIKSILEIGVGDGELLSKLNLENISYTGIDVSNQAINLLSKRSFATDIKIFNFDAEHFNFHYFDLIICKDVFQHLPNMKIIKILDLIKLNCSFALICNDIGPDEALLNKEIEIGGYRPLDLTLEPFLQNGISVLEWNSDVFFKRVVLFSNNSLSIKLKKFKGRIIKK